MVSRFEGWTNSELIVYIQGLEESIRGLERELIELTHECNDLSSANIMARAGNDYSQYGRGGDNL